MTEKPASWTDLIGESVHASDDQDIGDIEAVNRDFIVVKRGLVSVRRYYVPMSRVEGWDGNVVWLKIPEDQIKGNYERDVTPDPHQYHYSNAPVAADSDYPRKRTTIIPKIPPKYEEKDLLLSHPSGKKSREFSAATSAASPSGQKTI